MTCSFVDRIISSKIFAPIFRVYFLYSKKNAAMMIMSTVTLAEVGYTLSFSNTGCAEFSICQQRVVAAGIAQSV